jgi:hypothetical protein
VKVASETSSPIPLSSVSGPAGCSLRLSESCFGETLESDNKSYALRLFKTLKAMAEPDGSVHVDMNEVCRSAGLDGGDVRESLADRENEGYISGEIVVPIAGEGR